MVEVKMDDSLPNSVKLRPATLDDARIMAQLVNDCSIERTGQPLVTAQYAAGVLQTPGVNLETDTLLAFGPKQELAACALLQDTAPHTSYFAIVEVHPEFRRRGIGSMLCHWVQERARSSLPLAPEGERVAIRQQRLSTDGAARDLLVERGYRVVRHNFRMAVELEAPPPVPMLPAGFAIRPFVREREGRALVRALREGFRDSWGYEERPFEEEYELWMHMLDRDPDNDSAPFWFVALEGEEIAGVCLCSPQEAGDQEMAWIHALAVRPAWRRRGLALALLRHSFGQLYQAGRSRIALEVDTQNPTGAMSLYEKAGMRVERQYDLFEKELRPGK
jgi:ribosomal protein S18 acetylase RimI-like enzyme